MVLACHGVHCLSWEGCW